MIDRHSRKQTRIAFYSQMLWNSSNAS